MTIDVRIPIDGDVLLGDLCQPEGASGVVAFIHGSGSSRRSPRNGQVAAALNDAGIATLLVDLLSPAEGTRDARTEEFRYRPDLIAERAALITGWCVGHPILPRSVGLFGASTGAAGALFAASMYPDDVCAVVCRGGRTDLARDVLHDVRAGVLLIAGSRDEPICALNREDLRLLGGEASLQVVPGASHLFEEPGAMRQVCDHARTWFVRQFASRAAPTPR